MAISIAGRPSPVCWTKNPITFTFLYTLVSTTWKLHLQIIDFATSGVYAEVLYPFDSTAGTLDIDLDGLLDPLVSFDFPANLTAVSEFPSGKRPVRLRWRTYDTTSQTYGSWTVDGQDHIICKGGIADLNPNEEYRTNNAASIFSAIRFFPTTAHNYLTWLPDGKLITPDEDGFLLYLSTIANNDQRAHYEVTYNDNTTANIAVNLPGYGTGDFTYKWFHIPVGIEQCNLDPTGKGVREYLVRVRRNNIGTTLLSSFRFRADNRPYYDTLTVHYINSISGTDTIKFRASIENGASFERKEYEQKHTQSNNYGRNPYYDSSLRLTWKANTGYISQEHATALLDLLNAQYVAAFMNSKVYPLRIKNKDAVYRNTKNKLNNFTIEFESAGTFRSLPRQAFDL